MRQQLIDLNAIQKIDLEIREVELAKDALPRKLKEYEQAIGEAKTELEELITQSELISTEISTIETASTAETDKARKWERRLNDIRNQREYQALSREVEGSRRTVRNNEEQVTEKMQAKEELDARIEALQDSLAENEVDGDAERAEVERKIAELDARIAEISTRKAHLIPKIKPQLMRRYDNVRAKRMGVGIVVVGDGSCSGCNMRLPPQLYNILMRADSLEMCPSCQRIMVFAGVIEEAKGTDSTDADAGAAAEAQA